MKKNAGFTLIELLVVVLIIGILSAVALPQYQKAVEKSRAASIQSLLRSLAQAKEEYFLANGKHARSFADLSVSLPSNYVISTDEHYGETASFPGKFSLFLDAGSHEVAGSIRLSDGSRIWQYYTPMSTNRLCLACPAASGSNRARELCLSFGFPISSEYSGNQGCTYFSID